MKLLPQNVTRSIARQVLLTKKNSPTIFFVGGIVGVIGAGVLACRATLKLEKNLDEIKRDFDDVKEQKALAESGDAPLMKYDEKAYYQSLGRVYARSAVKIGKLYGPSVIVGGISVAALTGSHIQLTRRNAALGAAFTAVTKAFDEYRERVREELGEEKELSLYQCMEDNVIEVDGKKQKVLMPGDPEKWSQYARFFDDDSRHWQPSRELNLIWVKCQQDWANHRLRARGYVLLNDVYDSLGIEDTSIGAIVGWVDDGEDGYIDFGLDKPYSKQFTNQKEPNLLLDFNVDGIVADLIDKKNGNDTTNNHRKHLERGS